MSATINLTDEYFMRKALQQACRAFAMDETPVGAVIVKDNKIIAQAYNQREKRQDPLWHAEAMAIQKAAKKLKSWRLNDCTLYVTLEPCIMCSGAIILSRVSRVVYGAVDPKAGAVQSLYALLADQRLNHRPEIVSGVLAAECGQILKYFFKKIRNSKRK